MLYNHSYYLMGVERIVMGKDGVFFGDYVNMMKTAFSRRSADMTKDASGVNNPLQVTPKSPNTSNNKKEQLSEWLHIAF